MNFVSSIVVLNWMNWKEWLATINFVKSSVIYDIKGVLVSVYVENFCDLLV